MPLQLERTGQFVHPLLQHFHHPFVAAIDVDFANPDRTRRFDVYDGIGRSNPGPAYASKAFPHTLDKPRPIIIPLVPVIDATEICHRDPTSAFGRVEERTGLA